MVVEEELYQEVQNNAKFETSIEDEAIYDEVAPKSTTENKQAVALYDYQAGDDDEISFDPDDIITEIEEIDDGWWRGKCPKTGKVGLFPANYVQLI